MCKTKKIKKMLHVFVPALDISNVTRVQKGTIRAQSLKLSTPYHCLVAMHCNCIFAYTFLNPHAFYIVLFFPIVNFVHFTKGWQHVGLGASLAKPEPN